MLEPTEILPYLYLGNQRNSTDVEALNCMCGARGLPLGSLRVCAGRQHSGACCYSAPALLLNAKTESAPQPPRSDDCSVMHHVRAQRRQGDREC